MKRDNPAFWHIFPGIASALYSSAFYLQSAPGTLHSCSSQPRASGVHETITAQTSMVQTQLWLLCQAAEGENATHVYESLLK